MWGPENYNHDLRKRAKGMNFGAVYGLSVPSIANSFELSMEDAQELFDKFWAAIPEVTAFQKRTIRNAKKTGTIYNFFGRPRRVKHWLSSPDRKDVSFGERTCKNSPIQSAGADIMKLAMIKIYKKILRNPNYEGKVQFLSTIHDEVNMSIDYTDRDTFMKIFTDFYNCMRCEFKGWAVPFEAGIEIGETWGGSFEFIWNDEKTKLVPNMVYIPRVEEVKVEAVDVEVKNIKINSDDDFSFDLDF